MEKTVTSGPASSGSIKPVKILSVANAPPMVAVPVDLHYFEGGTYKHRVVQNIRPTHFDELIVSSVFDTLPTFRYRAAPLNSMRNLARNAFTVARQARASLARPVVYSAPVLDLRSMGPNNVAHLLQDIIPLSLLARRLVGPELTLLTRPVYGPFRDLLEHFGLSPIWEDREITGEMIRISGTRGLAVYDVINLFDCNAVQLFPQVLLEEDMPSGRSFEKIFLARRASRSLKNQTEIEQLTNSFGYTTIFMEDYSISDQLSIAARAKHVIAMHGAAMGLLLVNKGLDSVIEVLPANVYHQWFPNCIGRRVRKYIQILPEYDLRIQHSGWDAIAQFKNGKVFLDAFLLERLLSGIHAAPPAAVLASSSSRRAL
jgi:hypothetical protein